MVPQSISDIGELIGMSAADILSTKLGGTRWYIPTTIPAEHAIAQAIGTDQAATLAEFKGGTTLEIPRNLGGARDRRNAEIVARAGRGEKSRDIALSMGLSQRQIRYILRKTITR